MWFEILPSALIIYVAFEIAPGLTYLLHKTFLGNPYRRDLRWQVNRANYLRDRRLTNNPYKFNGLEQISCDPEDCDQEVCDK